MLTIYIFSRHLANVKFDCILSTEGCGVAQPRTHGCELRQVMCSQKQIGFKVVKCGFRLCGKLRVQASRLPLSLLSTHFPTRENILEFEAKCPVSKINLHPTSKQTVIMLCVIDPALCCRLKLVLKSLSVFVLIQMSLN